MLLDVKVVLLGSSGSGKTSLFNRLLCNTFSDSPRPTCAATFGGKKVNAEDGKKVLVGVWDVPSKTSLRQLALRFIPGADAACICFDVTRAESWVDARYWAREVRRLEPRCCLFLVACKLDLLQLKEAAKRKEESPAAEVVTPPTPQQPGLVRRSLDLAGYASRESADDGDGSSGEDELAINRDDFAAYAAGIQAIPVAVSAKTGQGIRGLAEAVVAEVQRAHKAQAQVQAQAKGQVPGQAKAKELPVERTRSGREYTFAGVSWA